MSLEVDKVTYAFNKFFGVLVRDVKELNDELHSAIKKNYKVIDKASSEYMQYFWEILGSKLHESSFDLDANQDIEVVKDVTFKQIVEATSDTVVLKNSIYILGIFSYIKNVSSDDEVEGLFETSLRALNAFQRGDQGVYDDEVEDIIDDDLRYLFSQLKMPASPPSSPEETADNTSETVNEPRENKDGPDPMAEIFDKFGNSKICEIAKEVSQNIDISNLKIESPTDVLGMLSGNGDNNVLGNIVQQVTSTITTKMNKGEISQEDLVKEAMTMMGSLGGLGGGNGAASLFNNPLFSSMMKNMAKSSGGRASFRTDVVSKMATRDRLKKKLELRKK